MRTMAVGTLTLGLLACGPAGAVDRAPDPAAAGPVATALSLRMAEADPLAVHNFYVARSHAPVWLTAEGAPTRAARQLVAVLSEAGSHALAPETYDAAGLAAALAAAPRPAREAALLELSLTQAYLDYAVDVSSGALEPARLDSDFDIEPPRPEPARLLERLAAAADVSALLRGLAPQHSDYAALRERYARYLALAEADAWGPPVPEGPTLTEGDRSPRVRALRKRLDALAASVRQAEASAQTRLAAAETVATDADLGAAHDPAVYDAALMEAVRRFQARHGLNEDGLAGPATLRALNRSPAYRARQIAANLERLRWLNRPLGDRHVMVNLAGFRMALVDDGVETFESRVVIGKTRFPTAEFSDVMEFMVVNPAWHVPTSIVRNEILPKLREDPTYLTRQNMVLTGVDVDPEMIAWEFITPSTFPGRVKQRPGRNNALGQVKFKFPNHHAIYLHDTPQKSLFRHDRRAYSHGCVRVMKPYEFAHRLLERQLSDPEAMFNRWLARETEIYVHLDDPVPVHITYRTAPVAADGSDQFRGDVYGRDRRIAAALEERGVRLPPA